MNKTLLAILLLCSHAQISISQLSNYLDLTAVWNEQGGYFDGVAETHLLYYSYSITGDTTINSSLYFKLWKSGVDSASGNTFYNIPPSTTVINEYRAALREDSGKFYFINNGSTNEYLLYDFNMAVGDTVPQTSGVNGCGWDVVVSTIDTVYLGIQPKRRFILSTGYSVVEGVGINSGLFGKFCQFIESGYKLKCFSQNNELLVIDTALNCELTITAGINDNHDSPMYPASLKIYPNPMDDFAYITLSQKKLRKYRMVLYNSMGQVVRVVRNIVNPQFILEKKNLSPGLYSIQVYDSNGVIGSGKIVVR